MTGKPLERYGGHRRAAGLGGRGSLDQVKVEAPGRTEEEESDQEFGVCRLSFKFTLSSSPCGLPLPASPQADMTMHPTKPGAPRRLQTTVR